MTIHFTVTTNTSPLNLRSGPGTTYPVVGKLQKGSQHNAISESGNWYKVAEGSWCSKTYCTETGREEDKPTEESSAQGTVQPNTETGTTNIGATEEQLANAQSIYEKIIQMANVQNTNLATGVDGSVRLFGLPHQLIESNDYRISSVSNLGRMFTETFVMDAPLIYLKPGTSNFLPGMSDEEKDSIKVGFIQLAADNIKKKVIAEQMAEWKDDNIRYFDFIQKYAEYISNVNLLCRIGAVFLNLSKEKVPWHSKGNVTYGQYDWRYYNFGQTYQNIAINTKKLSDVFDNFGAFIKDTLKTVVSAVADDDKFVRFYVDANASFSESASNSTTQSIVNTFTDQLEGIGKELAFVSGATGLKIDDVISESTSNVDNAISSIAKGDGSISTFLRRLTGTSSQLLSGANFLAPDVWSDSEYSKSYSFTISLSTPYGNKEAWYLNIFVPLMHILAMALPVQVSANTFTAPYLVRAFSPGWFSCDLGIIDSISIDKGGSGDAWSSVGLPNEIKVTVSIRDLYSNLALPDGYSAHSFFNNSGLITFLMVNCGIDVTQQGLADKTEIMVNLFSNNLESLIKDGIFDTFYNFQEAVQSITNVFNF